MIQNCPVCGKDGKVMIFRPYDKGPCYEMGSPLESLADRVLDLAYNYEAPVGFPMNGGWQEELPFPEQGDSLSRP